MGKLFFIGDSITAGAWDEQGGWANRLVGQVMAKTIAEFGQPKGFRCLPYNLGISGSTVRDNLSSMPAETALRRDFDNPDEQVDIVCALGCNDATFTANGSTPVVSQKQFRTDLESFVTAARAIRGALSFVGMIPVDDDLIAPIRAEDVLTGANDRVRLFESIIGEVSAAYELPFLPMFEMWYRMPDYRRYLIDDSHPNTAGHALMAEQIGQFLLTDEFFQRHSQ